MPNRENVDFFPVSNADNPDLWTLDSVDNTIIPNPKLPKTLQAVSERFTVIGGFGC
jgi:hypothetical protein